MRRMAIAASIAALWVAVIWFMAYRTDTPHPPEPVTIIPGDPAVASNWANNLVAPTQPLAEVAALAGPPGFRRRVVSEQRDSPWANAQEARLTTIYRDAASDGEVNIKCTQSLCAVAGKVASNQTQASIQEFLVSMRDRAPRATGDGLYFNPDPAVSFEIEPSDPQRMIFSTYLERSDQR